MVLSRLRRERESWAEPVAADRLLLFSDAVFAISATLLVLDIRVPSGLDPAQFNAALRAQLPAVVAYALSFGVIGQLWMFQHRIFGFIARADTPILVRSLVFLGLVAFLPFPVRLFSDYHDQPAAVVIYLAVFTAASLLQRLLWVYATGRQDLLARPVPDQLRRRYNLALTTMPLGFGVMIPVALVAPSVALVVWVLLLTGAAIARRLRPAGEPVPVSRHRGFLAGRDHGWLLAWTTRRPGGANLRGEGPHGPEEGGLR